MSIYYPVWADCYGGSEKQKATWMSVLLFSSSFGVLVGYIVTAEVVQVVTWQWAFYIQILVTVPLCLIIALTPLKYLDLNHEAHPQEPVAAQGVSPFNSSFAKLCFLPASGTHFQ